MASGVISNKQKQFELCPQGFLPRLKSSEKTIMAKKLSVSDSQSQSGDPPDGNKKPQPKDSDPPSVPPKQEVVKLPDIIQKLESLAGVAEKIDIMAEDFKQLRVIQETTSKQGQDLSEVQDKVSIIQSNVTSLEAHKEESDRTSRLSQKYYLI